MNIRANSLHVLGAATLAVGLAFASGCASTSPSYSSGGNYNSGYSGYGNCHDCGTVTGIESASSSMAGAVIGGIVGAVAGHEISAHTGGSKGNQNLSAVAGAAAGAVAGNAIANNRASSDYVVHIRMSDGRMTSVRQSDLYGVREGSRVRISNGRAYLQ